jgi:hypothetical protein
MAWSHFRSRCFYRECRKGAFNAASCNQRVISQLAYRDVGAAAFWLCTVFGFKEQ